MTMFGRVFGAVPLAGMMLLASCGGGGETAVPQGLQASPGIAVGEASPNTSALVTTPFVARAQEESCADYRNRLFVIDNRQVFWDRSGNCADNAYAQRLFGATPEALLCATSDSIAGPRTSCTDDKSRTMFEIIVKNLDQADLGLGSAHKVEAVPFLPKDGTGIAFSSLVEHAFSGVHTAKNVVIKEEAAWARLWAEHASGSTPAPALPKVDFSKNMLLGVFAGEKGSGCRQVGVIKVAVSGGKIAVELEERDLTMVALCSAPANVVVIPRSDAEVVFAKVTPEHLAFQDVDRSTRSQMVVGAFLGKRMNGCYSTDIMNIYRTGQKITVQRIDWEPGAGLVCTLAIVSPAHLVTIERSEDPVEFSSQIQALK